MIVALTVGGKRPVLGGFGKAIEGSVALNFATSGGKNCATTCRLHPDNGGACYAAAAENSWNRRQLLAKLQRHESTDPAVLVDHAIREVTESRNPIPWFRFSSFGSVPMEAPGNFRTLVALLVGMDIPIHLPVESEGKANHYRDVLSGLPVAVRESISDPSRWTTATGPVSIVAGNMAMSKPYRIRYAKNVASARSAATGRKTIVCPAVASKRGNDKAKCGSCTACSRMDIDIVYPMHK